MGNYSQPHVCQCLSRLATARRNYPVTIAGNRRKTGRQFVEEVLRLASGLSELGLRTGDIVAISALNSDLYLEWLLAVAFVGGIAAPLNYRWSLEEARLALEIVGPILLLTDTNSNYWHSEFRVDYVPSLKWHVFMNSPIEFNNNGNELTTEILKKTSLSRLSFNYSWAPGGTAMICFTSGTTGKPKGVTISHSALIVQSLAKIAIVGFSEDDVYLHTSPLCHIGGISSAMAMLMAGGCHVLIPKFEAKSAIDAIMQHHVTYLITVPAMMADLSSLMRTKEAGKSLQMVKKVLNGGGGLSVELIKDATRIFPEAKLLSAYGMTETCSSLTFITLYGPTIVNPGQPFKVTSGASPNLVQLSGSCVGKPAPHVEVKIRVEDSSRVGRILTRGPHVMLGYWGQVTSNASDPSDEDWLDTGDIGHIDDYGNLWLIGRTKGRIKSGGENVYPEEVEAVMSRHPGVAGVVVIGLPDARLTEIVAACIQIRDHWQWADLDCHNSAMNINMCISSEILKLFCREKNLTGFKIPKIYVTWRKPFPLTTTGKLRRDQVRREVMSEMHVISSSL